MTIKKSPSDFQVEELLKPEFPTLSSDPGPYALYRLHKQGLATPEATAHIARQIGVPATTLAYAGLKDKHASTIQHITIKAEKPEHVPEKLAGPGWELERLGFVPRSITASDIHRNRFCITFRNLLADQCADMDQAVKLLSVPEGQLRVINYFGAQRFGSARHHQGFLARLLIKGDFEGALKLAIATVARKDRMDQKVFKRTLLDYWGRWHEVLPKLRRCPERRAVERLVESGRDFRAAFCALPYLVQQLSVYAYQSYLWNETVRRLVEQVCTSRGQVLLVDSEYGQMLFPATEATPPELVGLNIPLLARKTELAGAWKQAAEETLKAESIQVSDLQIPGVRRPFFGEEPRTLFFTTENFQLAAPEADDTARDKERRKRRIEFALPSGAYATVLLRALGQ